MRKAYLISSIEEYGKFISFCINHDISVFRLYWDELEKGDRCYCIDFRTKHCSYASRSFWENEHIPVVLPSFALDNFGNYQFFPCISSGTPDDK